MKQSIKPPAGGQQRETVLIVDDDPEWRSHLTGIVGRHYTVITACDGDEALRVVAESSVRVIILDVMMADGKNGFETICALKKNPKTSAIPVIMLSEINRLTGLDFSEDEMENYLGATPFAFLEKPVDAAALLKVIASAADL